MSDRVIKFRAWNKDTKKMINLKAITPLAVGGNLPENSEGLYLPFDSNLKDCCPCTRCAVIVAEKDATISRLRELLKDIEWSGYGNVACPKCGQAACNGHAPDCELKKLLEVEYE